MGTFELRTWEQENMENRALHVYPGNLFTYSIGTIDTFHAILLLNNPSKFVLLSETKNDDNSKITASRSSWGD